MYSKQCTCIFARIAKEREEDRERERERSITVCIHVYISTRKLIAARTDEGNEGRSSLRLAYNIKQSGLNE